MSNRPSESPMSSFMPTVILLGTFVLVLWAVIALPAGNRTSTPTSTALPPPTVVAVIPTVVTVANVAPAYDAALVIEGEGIFQSSCATCHSYDARGIPGLGKNLIESEFVHGLSDSELLTMIITGRDSSHPLNTSGIPMPARGGNPSLTDAQLSAVIVYLRSESIVPAVAQAVPTTSPTTGTLPSAPEALPTVSSGTPPTLTSIPVDLPNTPQPFDPSTAYVWACSGCHGADGQGNPPFGPGFQTSPLMIDASSLLIFLREGRPLADPRIAFPHPAMGGYPILTEEQLSELIDYLSGF